jgi:hypothetical protein
MRKNKNKHGPVTIYIPEEKMQDVMCKIVNDRGFPWFKKAIAAGALVISCSGFPTVVQDMRKRGQLKPGLHCKACDAELQEHGDPELCATCIQAIYADFNGPKDEA